MQINDADLIHGDCLEAMRDMPDCSVDACVTDPPYHLTSIVKRFGADNAKPPISATQRRFEKTGAAMSLGPDGKPTPDQYGRLSKGFMGKTWDGGDIAFRPETWAEVLRVLKPGGHLLAFSGTRTQHRMVCAIEDAGFEIRDMIAWVYGSGFPKSHDVAQSVEKMQTTGKARRPDRDLGGLTRDRWSGSEEGTLIANTGGKLPLTTEAAQQWQGWGTALKPALEPVTLARKPLIGTVAANVMEFGTGALNVDGCRVGTDDNLNGGAYSDGDKDLSAATSYATGVKAGEFVQPLGRWPANLIHDGSDEVVGLLDESARFFYTAKASKGDRNDGVEETNIHPTVKPTDLMRYLCRLVTPPRGIVLDPFMGSGSTGMAAQLEGFQFIGCEMEQEYFDIAVQRIRKAGEQPDMFKHFEASV